MTENNLPPTLDKKQSRMKLLRRIFYLIIMVMLLPVVMFPLIRMTEGASDMSNEFYFAIIAATLLGLVMIAYVLLGIGPVVLELLDIRKQEKEEKEDMGMFP